MSQIEEKSMEGYKETELGLLPESWGLKPISKLVEKTKQKDMRKTDFKFKYIDVSSVDRDLLRVIDYKQYHGKNAPSRARKIVKKNDVIIATVRPTLKRISLIDDEFDNQICSTAFCILRAKSHEIDYRFLYYAIQKKEFIDNLGKIQRGASYPAVTDSDIKNQRISVPPLPEQQKIAYVLSSIQNSKEKTENMINSLQEFKKSVLEHLLTYGPIKLNEVENVKLSETEIGVIPGEWEIKSLGEIADVTKLAGFEYTKHVEYVQDGEIIAIRALNLKDGRLELNDIKRIYKSVSKKLPRSKLHKGELLLSYVGTIGSLAIVPEDNKFHLAPNVAKLKVKDKKIVNYYLMYYLSSIKGKRELFSYVSKTSQPVISMARIRKIKTLIPPNKTQKVIVEILSSIDKKIQTEENKKKSQEELFKSMLHNLMTARIRVNDLVIPNGGK